MQFWIPSREDLAIAIDWMALSMGILLIGLSLMWVLSPSTPPGMFIDHAHRMSEQDAPNDLPDLDPRDRMPMRGGRG